MHIVGLVSILGAQAGAAERTLQVLASEFIYEQAPFRSCHASTIVQTPGGLVAAWFGGSAEGKPDVGIWLSRHDGQNWSAPVEVANGKGFEGKQYPCWNPVLFQLKGGPLVLFYKVGPNPRDWWGMRMTSDDGGRTWSKPVRLGEDIYGPIKNKPLQLANGSLLCPSSTEHNGQWKVHLEQTADLGDTCTKAIPLADPRTLGAIQPSILTWPADKMQILCRSRQGKLAEAWSEDGGRSWGPMQLTQLPNPNSGIDAVMLREGVALLVYNHTSKGRSPLNLALSTDGRQWTNGPVLEKEAGEYSYPAVIQASDGRIHITYTWKRQRIKHVIVALVEPR